MVTAQCTETLPEKKALAREIPERVADAWHAATPAQEEAS